VFNGGDLAVNPWDYNQCARAIKQALEMGDEEKTRRWEQLSKQVNSHTGSGWFMNLMSRLDRVYEEQLRQDQTSVPRLSIGPLAKQYKRSNRRLMILDYEGTLVNWGPVNKIIPVSPQVSNTEEIPLSLHFAAQAQAAKERALERAREMEQDLFNDLVYQSGEDEDKRRWL
jgi:hypothetical protein